MCKETAEESQLLAHEQQELDILSEANLTDKECRPARHVVHLHSTIRRNHYDDRVRMSPISPCCRAHAHKDPV